MSVRVACAGGFNLPIIEAGGPSNAHPSAGKVSVDLLEWGLEILNYVSALSEYQDRVVCTARMHPKTLELLKLILGENLDMVVDSARKEAANYWGITVILDPTMKVGLVTTSVDLEGIDGELVVHPSQIEKKG